MNEQSVPSTLGRRARAQFGEMMNYLNWGWRPAPRGRKCPECGGPVWMKSFGRRRERHLCTSCRWGKEYLT